MPWYCPPLGFWPTVPSAARTGTARLRRSGWPAAARRTAARFRRSPRGLPGYIVAAEHSPLWQVALAVIAFSLFNAALEESLFPRCAARRDGRDLTVQAALIVRGVAFGFFHFQGFPSGWTGMLMAGVWGSFLGVLRVRSRGLLLPYLAHIGADATIAVITVASTR
ncbi:CPBP family intramembrane metalloprotease [Amycolatopsis roodepoortensis]|uniref:CPBP family intramembrane glutamic endopeptidase n=1 Tax=Amycolatopsis roodepoortensis TaxID=700274 RepID=UPI00214ADBB0|nr:CPBP family intramembrane glutamic endopeptidase [Amycolatopsis roodepoortensis]UUV32982.1 CPBP family intramembrane metalloprotease [Amycolatopsis roodepoortensis]